MAKIALAVEQAIARRAAHGSAGGQTGRLLARGDGWIVEDVLCTCGPEDRPFEERHSWVSIAIVAAGSFQYRGEARGASRPELMTPGSILLGNPGQHFECTHAHAAGDRCISFRYAPAYFETLAEDIGTSAGQRFQLLRLPPMRPLAPLVARSCAGLVGGNAIGGNAFGGTVPWEELSVQLASRTLRIANGLAAKRAEASRDALAAVTRIVRTIERHPDARLTLGALARSVQLSPYHFLRVFERVTGVTPHQYLLRIRLREAAVRLAVEPSRIVDVALESGFGDVSNFNRTFRAEFGVAPRAFRRHTAALTRGTPTAPPSL